MITMSIEPKYAIGTEQPIERLAVPSKLVEQIFLVPPIHLSAVQLYLPRFWEMRYLESVVSRQL